VYLPKEVGQQLNKITKELHCSRNSILVEALKEWLEKHQTSKWPKGFFDFEPVEDVPDFKALRNDLLNNIKEDPLA
jgi:hypothetical protein